ncbi:hypothetical protein GCM10022247_68540 [Allokutzneria multivorans]|uniref:Uncharacterized protein n=1 Tax=Allokutzneria multivorans TaxID=1142134 RepID=A0ABP7TZZ0_9PSEU
MVVCLEPYFFIGSGSSARHRSAARSLAVSAALSGNEATRCVSSSAAAAETSRATLGFVLVGGGGAAPG